MNSTNKAQNPPLTLVVLSENPVCSTYCFCVGLVRMLSLNCLCRTIPLNPSAKMRVGQAFFKVGDETPALCAKLCYLSRFPKKETLSSILSFCNLHFALYKISPHPSFLKEGEYFLPLTNRLK